MPVNALCPAITGWFVQRSRWKIIGAGLAMILIVNLVLFPLASRLWEGPPLDRILDLRLYYSGETARTFFQQIGEKGRQGYFYGTLLIDVPYALFYGWVYALLLAKLMPSSWATTPRSCLILLPFGIALADVVENVFILMGTSSFPVAASLLAPMGYFTALKWGFVIINVLMLLLLVFRKLLRKRP